ncbi:MAG TPA: hypothetical protein VFW78_00285 [Bacteroidia bacterium]|nr:hypothetical protein [Bacteroidia bacterium]
MKELCYSILLSLLGFANLFGQDNKVKIEVPAKYSGWVYLVSATNKESASFKDSTYVADDRGIAYIDSSVFNSIDSLRIYKKNQDITNKGAVMLFFSEFTADEKIVPFMRFYVLNKQELGYDESYWKDEANRRPYRQQEYSRQDSLLQTGVIHLDY